MQVMILSRAEMEKRLRAGPLTRTAVISFYDPPSPRTPPGYAPVDYRGKCPAVFQVAVHDIDPQVLDEYGLSMDTYLPEAEQLAQFIHRAAAEKLDIVCQCEYGQSRSAACAAAIREHFHHDGIRIFADYRYYPNQMIFNKLLDALTATAAP